MKIQSPAFEHQHNIPKKYTCEGEDVSPPLIIQELPENTKSLAIIVDDPDAPSGTFDHWIAWNIEPQVKNLPEGAKVPLQGKNHFDEIRYRGPCPPPGKVHHYHFKVYALDKMLDLKSGATKEELEEAMKGSILGQEELIGTYKR